MGKHSSGGVKEVLGKAVHSNGTDHCWCGRVAASLVYEKATHTWVWFCGTCGVQEVAAE